MLLKSPEDFVTSVAAKLSHGEVNPRPRPDDLKEIIILLSPYANKFS